jgi:hypothetical protein
MDARKSCSASTVLIAIRPWTMQAEQDDDQVVLHFSRPVKLVAMDAGEARALARVLTDLARKAEAEQQYAITG